MNEYSTRYSEAIDEMATTESTSWRLQSKGNKQGSSGYLGGWSEGWSIEPMTHASGFSLLTSPLGDVMCVTNGYSSGDYLSQQEADLQNHAKQVYEERLSFGVAREQARKDLPLSNYTEAYWKIDLHNLFNFLRQRLDEHAQLEIREFAQAIAQIVKSWVPTAWEAFVDYQLDACIISRMELSIIRRILEDNCGSFSKDRLEEAGLSKREQQEFLDKFSIQ